jgi:sarcosine oxidase
MELDTLKDLYVHELKDLYSAENQLIKALPKMAKAANSDLLRLAFEKHLEETRGQLDRLKEALELLEVAAKPKPSKGMAGLLQEGSEVIEGTRRAAKAHHLKLQDLDKREAAARFPTLKFLPNESILFEADGGVLRPEAAIRAHLQHAKAAGAEMRFDVTMESWRARVGNFEISLADGSKITARKLILSLGPWFARELAKLDVEIRVQRNVQVWFTPATHAYDAPGFPPFLVTRPGMLAPLYGFPDFGDGVKAAFHGAGELTEAAQLKRDVDPARDLEPLVRAMEDWMPGAAREFREAKVCMYSLTPDQHFIVDTHPEHSNLVLCGGFSGHGFKFAPVIGEIAADLALQGGTEHDIQFLSLRRFSAGQK